MTPAAPRSKGPLRVRMLSTFYPHLGDHMGFRQVRRHFDPARVEWTEQLVIKTREHLPLWFRAGRRMTRKWFSAPPAQYMLEDWLAERALLRAARAHPTDIVQILDGEHSFRNSATWMARLRPRPLLAALFHIPPELLDPLIVRDAVRRLDAVFTVSPDQADWFRSWVEPARVHLVLHGVDDVFFHPAPGGPPADPPWRVLTVGINFRDYDLVFNVARRLAHVRDLEFHVVRNLPPGTRIPPNVRVHKGISDLELAELYRSSHISLLPLIRATASNTLLEAMASGIPTVASDLPSLHAYTVPGETLFYPPGDDAAAADRIAELLRDPARRIEMGRASRVRAERTNWQASAAELMRLYERMAER